MKKKIEREKPIHKEAFEYYYSLGSKRSYALVAQRVHKSVVSIKNWGANFRWQDRVVERDALIAKAVTEKTTGEELSYRIRNKKIVQLAIVELAKAIAAGKIKMTLSDLDRLVRLEEFLNENPDSRPEIVGTFNVSQMSAEELRARIKKEVEELKRLQEATTQEVTPAEVEALPENTEEQGDSA